MFDVYSREREGVGIIAENVANLLGHVFWRYM